MSLPDYQIVVPSRKRAHLMETIRWLLPTSRICVDEREAEDYAPFVDSSRLWLHPPMDGMAKVVNWMMDNCPAECMVEIDDDFVGVQSNVGTRRYITDSEEILAIIENAMRCTHDLGLTTFCWSRTPNTTIIHPGFKPIVPTQAVCNAFGIMGKARRRHYDATLPGRAAVDWTLKTLLEDRAVFADIRFYFDCGRIFSGRGGNVGLITPEAWKETTKTIADRWGRYSSFKSLPFAKGRTAEGLKIAVPRTNKAAQR